MNDTDATAENAGDPEGLDAGAAGDVATPGDEASGKDARVPDSVGLSQGGSVPATTGDDLGPDERSRDEGSAKALGSDASSPSGVEGPVDDESVESSRGLDGDRIGRVGRGTGAGTGPTPTALLRQLLAAIDARRPVVLATVVATRRSVPRRAGSKMLVYGDGTTSGTIGGGEMEARVVAAALDTLATGRPASLQYSLVDPTAGDPGVCGGEVDLYLEPHMPTTTVFVVGAGHVGAAVVELAMWLGYRVVVWDDRSDLLDAVSADDSVAIASGPIADAVDAFGVDEYTRVVMVTRNVALDLEILPALLASPAPTIGLMGSRRRWETTRKALVAAGIAEADLARVHSPIGVEINAETPAEIAVSILAELVAHERS